MMNERMQKLAAQVAGKIHWGASRSEVREWLLHGKQLSDEDSERLIDDGFRSRRGEVRQRAVLRLVFSSVGLLLFAVFLYLQYVGRFIIVGIPVVIAWGLGLGSIGVVCHSAY